MTINYEFTIHGCACIYVCVSGLRYSFIIVTHLMHIKNCDPNRDFDYEYWCGIRGLAVENLRPTIGVEIVRKTYILYRNVYRPGRKGCMR